MNMVWCIVVAIVIGVLLVAMAFRCLNYEHKSQFDQAIEMLMKDPTAAGKGRK